MVNNAAEGLLRPQLLSHCSGFAFLLCSIACCCTLAAPWIVNGLRRRIGVGPSPYRGVPRHIGMGANSFRWAPHVAPTLEPAARVRSGPVSVAPVWLFAALGRTGGVIVAAATSDRISALSKSKSTSAASSILTSSVSVVSRASILAGRLRTANGKEAHAGRRKLEVGTGELDCGGLRRGVS
jgi:hypothetical protein